MHPVVYGVLVWAVRFGQPLSNTPKELLEVKIVRSREQRLDEVVETTASVAHENVLRGEFCSGPFRSRTEASIAKKVRVAELRKQGFGVNGDSRIWRVYVIELDQVHAQDPNRLWVYVGETCTNIDDRFEQHKQGKRNRSGRGRLFATVVRKYGLKLRPDLYPPEPNEFFSRDDSERAEQDWIRQLKSRGFQVEGGHKGKTKVKLDEP